MNPDAFAEWMRRQGHRVLRSESSYWYDAGPRVLQAFPYHWIIQPGEAELFGLLRRGKALALRYSTPLHNPTGCISYHVIYDQPDYTLESLDRRSRQNVRQGLKNCQVGAVSLEQLANEGWALELDTADRQGRQVSGDEASWRSRCLAAADLPGFEAWGAFVEGRLVATLLSFQLGDWCELISQQCHRDYLNARVNNALIFVVTQTMLARPEIHSIFYTLQSLDAPPSVDDFKFRMGYVPHPLRQRVVFHPLFAPLANRLSYAVMRGLQNRYPSNHTLAKAEGILRFHLQGHYPVENQNWPESLIDKKDELLEGAR